MGIKFKRRLEKYIVSFCITFSSVCFEVFGNITLFIKLRGEENVTSIQIS